MAKTFHNLLIDYYNNPETARTLAAHADGNPIPNEEALYLLFSNYRKYLITGQHSGLRLTKFGNRILSSDFESYTHEFEGELTNKVLMALDKHMTWPYFIDGRNITFYSKTDAAWFLLSGSNINTMADIT